MSHNDNRGSFENSLEFFDGLLLGRSIHSLLFLTWAVVLRRPRVAICRRGSAPSKRLETGRRSAPNFATCELGLIACPLRSRSHPGHRGFKPQNGCPFGRSVTQSTPRLCRTLSSAVANVAGRQTPAVSDRTLEKQRVGPSLQEESRRMSKRIEFLGAVVFQRRTKARRQTGRHAHAGLSRP